MKLCNIVTAYAALSLLCRREWTCREAKELLELRHALAPHVSVFAGQETALAIQYGKKEEDGRVRCDHAGHFALSAEADGAQYRAAYLAMANTEITPDWPCVTLTLQGKISPAEIESLTGFVVFEGGDAQ